MLLISIIKRQVVAMIAITFLFCLWSPKVHSITVQEFKDEVNYAKQKTKDDDWGVWHERIHVAYYYSLLLAETAVSLKTNAMGQVAKDGSYPIKTYYSGIATTEELTFFFIDPSTGIPTSSGPDVASVEYQVSYEPYSPFQSIGISNDKSSNFKLDFTIAGFEPFIMGIPFDDLGNPIVMDRTDGGGNAAVGYAVNLIVPTPPTIFLFGFSIIGFNIGLRILRPKG